MPATMDTIFLALVAQRLGIPGAKLVPLSGGLTTHVYQFEQDGRPLVLRLIPPGEDMDVQAQHAIMAWVEYLSGRGAAVAAPVPGQNGNLVEVVPGEGGDWLAILCEHATGILSETLPMERWDAPLIRVLGEVVGKMHALAREYIPPAGLRRPDWDAAGNLFNYPALNQAWLTEKRAPILERILDLPRGGGHYHLIHGDLHFANFFVDPDAPLITLFDFDDCCYGWPVMDLAVLLFDSLVLYQGQDKSQFGRYFMRHLLSGYRAENLMDIFWITQIPSFLKLLEINLYDEVAPYYDSKDDTKVGNSWGSRFIPGRRERIEKDLPYVDIDFEDLILSLGEEPSREEKPHGS